MTNFVTELKIRTSSISQLVFFFSHLFDEEIHQINNEYFYLFKNGVKIIIEESKTIDLCQLSINIDEDEYHDILQKYSFYLFKLEDPSLTGFQVYSHATIVKDFEGRSYKISPQTYQTNDVNLSPSQM